MVSNKERNQIVRRGEKYFSLLLSKKGIDSLKLSNNFCFDLICSNGKRIECKTSTIRKEKPSKKHREGYVRFYWVFRISKVQKNSNFDFFAFICLNRELEMEKVFIVPKKIIQKRDIISIPKEFKKKSYNGFSLMSYENNINILLKDKHKNRY